MAKPFGRFLDTKFRRFLGKQGAPLLSALAGLDLRIRDNAVNFYTAGNSALRIDWASRSLELHGKFIEGTRLGGKRSGSYVRLPLEESTIQAVCAELPRVLGNVAGHAKPEGKCEEQFVRENVHGGPLAILDRQVQLPGDSRQSRLDLVGVTSGPSPMFVAIELKYGLDNRIQDVPRQLHRYMEMLDPDGSGLSERVAKVYRVAAAQLAGLGRPAPDWKLIRPRMPVRGLLVLAGYKGSPELQRRARACARKLARPMGVLVASDDSVRVPLLEEWRLLQ